MNEPVCFLSTGVNRLLFFWKKMWAFSWNWFFMFKMNTRLKQPNWSGNNWSPFKLFDGVVSQKLRNFSKLLCSINEQSMPLIRICFILYTNRWLTGDHNNVGESWSQSLTISITDDFHITKTQSLSIYNREFGFNWFNFSAMNVKRFGPIKPGTMTIHR